jgi:hypothetical protein
MITVFQHNGKLNFKDIPTLMKNEKQQMPILKFFFDKHHYSRNVIDVDWGLVVKLALPGKVTRHAYKIHIWNL